MARRTTVVLIDDVNGQPAVETVQFALDRERLEIDLSADNADRLRAILGEFIAHARRVSGRPRRRAARHVSPRTRRSGAEPAAGTEAQWLNPLAYSPEVRAWARQQGLQVGARGRMSDAVVEAFQRRHRRRARRGR